VEPRTPAKDRFKVIPKDLEFANDYAVLAKYCDQVRVMAYDQGRIDLNLNSSEGTTGLYAPVADPDWVVKVLKETMKQVPASKIMLGIPTYGYEWRIVQNTSSTQYIRRRSVTYQTATTLMKAVNATTVRNTAGELTFTYTTTTITDNVATTSFRLVDFTDAAAVADKITLARKYKLRGAVLFKVDGMNDPTIWSKMK
jgi:spore germination protein YaaH